MGQPKEDATICKVCDHDMGRSRCKAIPGGWTVRCNKCKTHYDIIIFPKEDKKNMTVKYSVYDNDKPANSIAFQNLVGYGWDNNSFASFSEAQLYANKWLGEYATYLEVNVPYDYNGYGDLIEIREEPV